MMIDVLLGAVSLLFAFFVFLNTLAFPDSEASYKDPAVYPNFLLIIIAVLSVILIVKGVIKRVKKNGEGDTLFSIEEIKTPLLIFGISIVYFILLPFIGFLLATFTFLLSVFLVFGGKIRQGVIFSLIMTSAEYGLFGLALKVRLPMPIIDLIKSL